VYASLESVAASSVAGTPPPPPMPVRSYDKNLLPPTFRVQVDEGTEEQYEELPAHTANVAGGGVCLVWLRVRMFVRVCAHMCVCVFVSWFALDGGKSIGSHVCLLA
jgi:hypothetical protein